MRISIKDPDMKIAKDAQFFEFSKEKILIEDTCLKCKSHSVDFKPNHEQEALYFSCSECGFEWSEG